MNHNSCISTCLVASHGARLAGGACVVRLVARHAGAGAGVKAPGAVGLAQVVRVLHGHGVLDAATPNLLDGGEHRAGRRLRVSDQ